MSNSKCVYYKEKEQKSIDGGITWVDTGNFRKGGLISTQASQCGSFVTEYRWTKADYVCDNANKYKGYKQQVSHDNGGSWVDTGVVDIGSLIESNSKDCGYDEQWFVMTGDNNFICDGAAKYKKKEMKYTRDSGTTWNSFDPQKYEKGDLIAETSSDCASMKVTYVDGTTKYFANLTRIDENTVSDKVNVKEVEIYDGVKKIGNYAFNGCTSLTSIAIPNSVTNISSFAFYDCTSLTGVTIPDSVTNIGYAAFSVCKSLTDITIPSGVTSISEQAFNDCSSLTSITIPDSVTSIGKYAFSGCKSLTSIDIPDSVKTIDNYVFVGCSSLRTMTVNATTPPTLGYSPIPAAIQRIYVPADSVDVYKSANRWKNYADKIWAIGYDEKWFTLTGDKDFICSEGSKYQKKEMKYTRNSGTTWNSFDPPKYEKGDLIESNSSACPPPVMKVTYVDGSTKVFYDLTSIKSDTIPNKENAKDAIIYNGVNSIGESAFNGCSSLTSITIPDSVSYIGEQAFLGCTSLTSIRLPKNLTSIADRTFENCSGLINIKLSDYYDFRKIGKQAFKNCTNLTDIILYNSKTNNDYEPSKMFILPEIESMGEEAFRNCSSLPSIAIGDGSRLKSISDGAFEGCSNAKDLYVNSNIEKIGNSAFADCSSITSITFDNAGQLKTSSLASIGNNAFQNCSAVTSITIHDSVINIGSNAFNGSSNLTTVTIENSTSKLAYNTDAFANISSSAILFVPSNLLSDYQADSAWKNAFKGGIHAIGEFLSMKVTYVDGTEKEFYTSGTIDKNTDSNKANAKDIEIYNGVTRIEEDAFRNCTHITEITTPSSVGWIGKGAFLYCSNLKYVTIKAQTRLSYNVGAFSNIAHGAELLVPPSVWSLYKNDGNWSIAFNGRIYGYSE